MLAEQKLKREETVRQEILSYRVLSSSFNNELDLRRRKGEGKSDDMKRHFDVQTFLSEVEKNKAFGSSGDELWKHVEPNTDKKNLYVPFTFNSIDNNKTCPVDFISRTGTAPMKEKYFLHRNTDSFTSLVESSKNTIENDDSCTNECLSSMDKSFLNTTISKASITNINKKSSNIRAIEELMIKASDNFLDKDRISSVMSDNTMPTYANYEKPRIPKWILNELEKRQE